LQLFKNWTHKQCDILREILGKYKRFVADPFVCKYQTIPNYDNYARVELNALVNKEEEEEDEEEIDDNDFIELVRILGNWLFCTN
jgi:hypothetical protein